MYKRLKRMCFYIHIKVYMNKVLSDEINLGYSIRNNDIQNDYQTLCNIQYVHNILCAIFP